MQALTEPDKDGRIFIQFPEHSSPTFCYLLLSAREHLLPIITEARCVILAGGTLSPVKVTLDEVFPLEMQSKVKIHTFGHVVPKKNVFATILSKSRTSEFCFTFQQRQDESQVIYLTSSWS